MAKRGRKTKEKELGVVPRPAVAGDRWACPGHLTGVAREAWDHLVGLLSGAGNLEKTAPALIEAFAVSMAALRRAHAEVERDGISIEGSHGGLVQHPSWVVASQAARQIKMICKELGLTPASAKLSAPVAPKSDNKWERFGLGVTG